MPSIPSAKNNAAHSRETHAGHARAPGALLMLLEGRAPAEFAALIAASPWLSRLPRGDGHPVLVFPGMGASDVTTLPLRRFLQGPRLHHAGMGPGTELRPAPRRDRALVGRSA